MIGIGCEVKVRNLGQITDYHVSLLGFSRGVLCRRNFYMKYISLVLLLSAPQLFQAMNVYFFGNLWRFLHGIEIELHFTKTIFRPFVIVIPKRDGRVTLG